MSTLNQLVRRKRIKPIKNKSTFRGLRGCPQKKGTCFKVYIMKPKKPNSALRKVAKIYLSTGTFIIASIPGHGHKLMKYSVVLVRGGRSPDLPGVRYKLIRNKYDFTGLENIDRVRRRSKFGKKRIN